MTTTVSAAPHVCVSSKSLSQAKKSGVEARKSTHTTAHAEKPSTALYVACVAAHLPRVVSEPSPLTRSSVMEAPFISSAGMNVGAKQAPQRVVPAGRDGGSAQWDCSPWVAVFGSLKVPKKFLAYKKRIVHL